MKKMSCLDDWGSKELNQTNNTIIKKTFIPITTSEACNFSSNTNYHQRNV